MPGIRCLPTLPLGVRDTTDIRCGIEWLCKQVAGNEGAPTFAWLTNFLNPQPLPPPLAMRRDGPTAS